MSAEQTMRAVIGTFMGKAKANLFLPGIDKPIRDEQGHLVADPTKVKIIVSAEDTLTEHLVNVDNVSDLPHAGKPITLIFKTIVGFNEGNEFLYSVTGM